MRYDEPRRVWTSLPITQNAGERESVKEGGEEEGERERERVLGCDYATALIIEVDLQRRRFGRRESDFAERQSYTLVLNLIQ